MVRDFVLLGSSDRNQLELAVSDVARHWSAEWFCGEQHAVSVKSSVFDDSDHARINSRSPLLLGDIDGEWCAVALPSNGRADLVSALFADANPTVNGIAHTAADSLVQGVVNRALAGLGCGLCGERQQSGTLSVEPVSDTIPERAALKGSGVQALRVLLGDLELSLVISHPLVARLLDGVASDSARQEVSTRGGLDTLSTALAGLHVHAEALIGTVELSISALASLNAGDVIQLDRLARNPSDLCFVGTGVKCKGFIGQSEGRLALRLTAE